MKCVLILLALVAVAAAETCTGNDISTCTDVCQVGVMVCDHSLCTCASTCTQTHDCSGTCAHNGGHKTCIDGACVCDVNGGNGGNHHHNGGNHNPGHHGK